MDILEFSKKSKLFLHYIINITVKYPPTQANPQIILNNPATFLLTLKKYVPNRKQPTEKNTAKILNKINKYKLSLRSKFK